MSRNSRIVWVHRWYNKYKTCKRLIEISKKYSIELIITHIFYPFDHKKPLHFCTAVSFLITTFNSCALN